MRYLTKKEIISMIWEHICSLKKNERLCVRSQNPQGLWSLSSTHYPKSIDEVQKFIKQYDVPTEKIKDPYDIFWANIKQGSVRSG